MAIEKIGGAASLPSADPLQKSGKDFGDVFKTGGQIKGELAPRPIVPKPVSPSHAVPSIRSAERAPGQHRVQSGSHVDSVHAAKNQQAVKALDAVCEAQHRLDRVLHLAQSGKTFTPAELLALQANVYRSSQELDLAGKVVDKATGGIKQVLQTQI